MSRIVAVSEAPSQHDTVAGHSTTRRGWTRELASASCPSIMHSVRVGEDRMKSRRRWSSRRMKVTSVNCPAFALMTRWLAFCRSMKKPRPAPPLFISNRAPPGAKQRRNALTMLSTFRVPYLSHTDTAICRPSRPKRMAKGRGEVTGTERGSEAFRCRPSSPVGASYTALVNNSSSASSKPSSTCLDAPACRPKSASLAKWSLFALDWFSRFVMI